MNELAERYYWLQTDYLDKYLCVKDGALALCEERERAEQFSEDMTEFALPCAEARFQTEFRFVRVPAEALDLARMEGVINN